MLVLSHRRHGRRAAAITFSALAVFLAPAAAFAYSVVYYDGVSALNPGGYYSSFNPDFTFREYNQACRQGNSGQMSVSYVYGNGSVQTIGPEWTNCSQGAYVNMGYENNARARCTNEGTVSFFVDCITTKP